MRETIIKRVNVLVISALTILFLACPNEFQVQEQKNKALVSFSVTEARTVLPHVSLADIVSYKLMGGLNGAAETERATFTAGGTMILLEPGTWNFTLNAYNSAGGHILQGTVQNRQINASGPNQISFSLSPVYTGTGTIEITLIFPESAGITQINTNGDIVSEEFTPTSSGNFVYTKNEIAAGNYIIKFELYSGDVFRTVVSELVLVRNSLTSRKTITLVGEDLKPLLTGTVSISGTAIVGGTLTADTGDLDGIGTISYEWKRNSIIVGTDSTYTLQEADAEETITVTVTRVGYVGDVTSAPVAIPAIIPVTDVTLSKNTLTLAVGYGSEILTATVTPLDATIKTLTWETSNSAAATVVNGLVTAIGVGSATITVTTVNGGKTDTCTVTVTAAPTPTTGLAFTLINGDTAYAVSRGTATDTEVVIPYFYNGLPVTAIAENGFYNYSAMTSIAIPDSVTSIAQSAFYNCGGLTSITIPSTVTSIGNRAFSYCSGLTSITIPDSVESIGRQAFYDCSGLMSVSIGNSVTSLDDYVFFRCSGLESITVRSGNTVYRDEGNCLIRIADNVLIQGCKTSVIPNSVTSIGDEAFTGCSGLTSITIPDSVKRIGTRAFSDCSGLTSVTIPDSVESIGTQAFSGCSGLTSVTIPDSVESIGESVFGYCNNLESITVGSGNTVYRSEGNCIIQKSNNTLIQGCKTSVIPNSVTSIGSNAFSGCPSLTSITIPDSVTSIGDYAFYGCNGLTSVFYGGANDTAWSGITIGTDNTYLTNATRYYYSENEPAGTGNYWRYVDGVPEIWDEITPSGSPGLAYMLINGGTAYSVSKGDATDTEIVIPSVYNSLPVTMIANSGFDGYTVITSVTIPNSVTNIGNYAFYGCSGLTNNLTIPDSVTSIGIQPFYGCSGLTSVTMPSSVTSIGSGAFVGCNGLTSVFYGGADEAAWSGIIIGDNNTPLINATRYYYSEIEPVGPGDFWHWVGGVATVW